MFDIHIDVQHIYSESAKEEKKEKLTGIKNCTFLYSGMVMEK
jgi:hypothetical protein